MKERAITPRLITVLKDEDSAGFTSWIIWLIFFLFAFIFHWAILSLPVAPLSVAPAFSPMPVQTINPNKLETIRRQWKKKSLLLNPSKNENTKEVEPPPDARYFSNRNVRVEKEQQGRRS